MFKKILAALLLAVILLSSCAGAEVTNRDYQMMGSVVVKNSSDYFFFCPMEEGNTGHWGLYSVNTCADGPFYETNGYPGYLVYATSSKVYFLGYTNADRTNMTLFSVDIASGKSEALLEDIACTYIGDSADTFFYVSSNDAYTLCSYDITNNKNTKLKDMSKWSKKIWDAMSYGGNIYFTTRTDLLVEDSYQYYPSSSKATNLNKPSPTLVLSVMYEGYQIYANDSGNSRIYSIPIGGKKGVAIGRKYSCSLNNPRYGNAIYCYDAENNALVRCPLDGSAETSLPLDGDLLSRLLVFGNAEELLFYADGAIYTAPASLSSSTRLFDFSLSSGGQLWSYLMPAGDHIIAMGYDVDTYTFMNNMMPTGVRIMDRETGEVVFNFPEIDESEAAAQPAEPTVPQDGETVVGRDDVFTEENEETIFF